MSRIKSLGAGVAAGMLLALVSTDIRRQIARHFRVRQDLEATASGFAVQWTEEPAKNPALLRLVGLRRAAFALVSQPPSASPWLACQPWLLSAAKERRLVRAPGVEPGSTASEAATLSIVLRPQGQAPDQRSAASPRQARHSSAQ